MHTLKTAVFPKSNNAFFIGAFSDGKKLQVVLCFNVDCWSSASSLCIIVLSISHSFDSASHLISIFIF